MLPRPVVREESIEPPKQYSLTDRQSEYTPDENDALDVAVATILRDFAVPAQRQSPVYSQPNIRFPGGCKYTFGTALNNRTLWCRLAHDQVLVRRGGGWQPLGEYLTESPFLADTTIN